MKYKKENFTETPQGGAKSGVGVTRSRHHNPDKPVVTITDGSGNTTTTLYII